MGLKLHADPPEKSTPSHPPTHHLDVAPYGDLETGVMYSLYRNSKILFFVNMWYRKHFTKCNIYFGSWESTFGMRIILWLNLIVRYLLKYHRPIQVFSDLSFAQKHHGHVARHLISRTQMVLKIR